jgi:hypothetical protein
MAFKCDYEQKGFIVFNGFDGGNAVLELQRVLQDSEEQRL